MSEANTPAAAPAEGEQGGPLSDFDKDFQAFMSHDFGTPELQDEDAGSTQAAPAADDTIKAGDGNDTVSGTTAEIAPSSGEGTDSAATTASSNVASTVQGAAGDDQIDPALLAAMQGFSTPAPAQGASTLPSGSAVDKVEPTPPASSSQEEEKDYMPFTPDFKLAPAVVSALFESEDPEVREKALVGLLSSYGNAIAATVMRHVQKEVLPASFSRFSESVVQDQTRNAVQTSFYSAFPELQAYKPAVQKAFAIIAQAEPQLQWGEVAARKVANLAATALKSSGIPISVKALEKALTPPAALPPVNPSKAPGSGFEAGGSRLSSENLNTPDGPADLVRELTEHW